MRHAFHGIACTINKAPIAGRWKLLGVLSTFIIKYGLLLITFGEQFTIKADRLISPVLYSDTLAYTIFITVTECSIRLCRKSVVVLSSESMILI